MLLRGWSSITFPLPLLKFNFRAARTDLSIAPTLVLTFGLILYRIFTFSPSWSCPLFLDLEAALFFLQREELELETYHDSESWNTTRIYLPFVPSHKSKALSWRCRHFKLANFLIGMLEAFVPWWWRWGWRQLTLTMSHNRVLRWIFWGRFCDIQDIITTS